MDIITWLDDMECLYDDLIDVDPDALSDHGYALLLMNNLPEMSEWRTLAGGLRKCVEECNCSMPPTPVSCSKFITSIKDEYHFRNKNNPDTMAQVFTARYEANKDSRQPPKHTRPFNVSYSSTALPPTTPKRACIQKTCTNSSCGRNGHDTADCFAFGSPKQGTYPTWWKGPWNLHLPPLQHNANTNKPSILPPDKKPVITQSGQANLVTADSGTNTANLVIADQQDLTDPSTFPPITYTDCREPPNLIFVTEDTSDPIVATIPFLHQDKPKSDICLYDSGANRHVFNNCGTAVRLKFTNPFVPFW
jgi:hypothetical protein